MSNLFINKPDPFDGFEEFWACWPRDRRRPGRKSGKAACKHNWRRKRLYLIKDKVLAALMEDKKGIDKGSYKLGEDPMYYFVGIQPWLNQDRFDRDIEIKQEEPSEPIKKAIIFESAPSKPMSDLTLEEKHRLKAIAFGLAKPWPRSNGTGVGYGL